MIVNDRWVYQEHKTDEFAPCGKEMKIVFSRFLANLSKDVKRTNVLDLQLLGIVSPNLNIFEKMQKNTNFQGFMFHFRKNYLFLETRLKVFIFKPRVTSFFLITQTFVEYSRVFCEVFSQGKNIWLSFKNMLKN